eukprot:jgi/Psemu1/33319/gm1.33319_g
MESVKERIYIGGLNPPRLSAKDIFRRLQSLNQIEIESASIVDNGKDDDSSSDEYITEDDNKPYLHITAVSKHDSDSALSIISKQYHNVKWKGCKLVVEKARPHFLERLEEERRQIRTEATEEKAEEIAKTTEAQKSDDPSEAIPSRIPRRLRVRKKFGDTAVHVDTKPWTVESWSRFHKARSKLQKRDEKHSASIVAHKKNPKDQAFKLPGPLLHRAVHIRFATDDTGIKGTIGSGKNDNDETGTVISSSESSSESSSSGSDSDSDSGSLKKNTHKEKESERFSWSDNDSDSDSDSDDSKDDNKNFPDDDSQSTAEMLMNQKRKEAANSVAQKQNDEGKYQWSSDEESSDDDDEDQNKNETSFHLARNEKQLDDVKCCGTDEFAAGFEDTSSFDKDDTEDQFEGNDQAKSENIESDLIGDVTANLNILSSIFPDMVDAKPINPDDADSSNLNKDTTSSSSTNQRNNSGAYGIMPRYDPTAKSSRQYVVEEEAAKKDDENDSASSSDSEQDEDVSMDEEKLSSNPDEEGKNETETKSSPPEGVYEQDKLENVFRDARDAWGTEDTSKSAVAKSSGTTENADESSGKGAFSFGFNFDDHSDKSNTQSSNADNSANKPFSFSFSVPDQEQTNLNQQETVTERTEQKGNDFVNTTSPSTREGDFNADDGDVDMTDDNSAPPQKGLTLPDGDLQKYVDNFFACNNGVRIMQDPEGFRNDEGERSEWNKERQTLTLDWKRKRKYAVTRIQKRMKTGRR